jgi:hypothetical protein
MADPTFVHFISKKLEEGYNGVQALRLWVLDENARETVTVTLPVFPSSLNKQIVGTVDFLGESVDICTVNGQFTRSPKGANIIEFTMGGNWYGGTKKETYWPICREREVVIHEAMPYVDFIATTIHEMVERYALKYIYRITEKSTQEEWSKAYDEAHTKYAEPVEAFVRSILEREAA